MKRQVSLPFKMELCLKRSIRFYRGYMKLVTDILAMPSLNVTPEPAIRWRTFARAL